MKRRMRFGTWCKKDINDDRIIHYTFKCNGEVKKFTSEDELPRTMLSRLGKSWIKSIKLIDGEWFAELYED